MPPPDELFPVESSFRELVHQLCPALQACGTDDDALLRFLRDLLTPEEAKKLVARWRIAQMLLDGATPTKIVAELHVTHALVRAVSDFAIGPYRTGGYGEVHHRLKSKQP